MLDDAPRKASLDIQKERLNKAEDVRMGSKIHHQIALQIDKEHKLRNRILRNKIVEDENKVFIKN